MRRHHETSDFLDHVFINIAAATVTVMSGVCER